MIKFFESEIKLTEILTILFVISVGYGLIVKVAFYNFIGLPWLQSALTPTLIFYTTIIVFFQLLIGVTLGIGLAKRFSGISHPNFILVFLLILIISGIPAFSLKFNDSIFLINSINEILTLHFILYCTYQTYLIENNRVIYSFYEKKPDTDIFGWFNSSPKFIMSLFFILLVMSPTYFGSIEASKVIKNTNFFYNQVKLKNDDSKWYLIEYIGDKAILKSAQSDKLVYKVVEIKEIDKIISNDSIW